MTFLGKYEELLTRPCTKEAAHKAHRAYRELHPTYDIRLRRVGDAREDGGKNYVVVMREVRHGQD